MQFLPNRTPFIPSIYFHPSHRSVSYSFSFYYVPGTDFRLFLRDDEFDEYQAYTLKLQQEEGRCISHNEATVLSRYWQSGWWALTAEYRAITFDDFELQSAQVDPTSEEEKQEAFAAALRYLAAHDSEWRDRFADLATGEGHVNSRWLISGIMHNLLALTAAIYLAWFLALCLYAWCRRKQFAPHECSNCGYDLRGANHRNCPECGIGFEQAQA